MTDFRRMAAIAKKESIHVIRDWRSLMLALAIPMLLIFLFGYALNLDLKKLPTSVWDQSRTPQSRELIAMFDGSPYFLVTGYHDGYRAIEDDLYAGKSMIAIVIPSDFADKLKAGSEAPVQVIADGSDATSTRLALSYAANIGMIYDLNVTARKAALAGKIPPKKPVQLDTRIAYNQDLRSENSIIPGIIALVMVVIAAMLTSVTIAKEWEMGTMEQLISTPVKVPEIVFGKVAPYFVIGMADVGIAVFMGHVLFGVPLRGSTGLVFLSAAIFLSGALFFGLLLSILFKSQILATQAALIASYLPTLMLSGFVFSVENMPFVIRGITYIVPAKYFIAILRGIYLKGIGAEILWINALLLTLYATIMMIAANKSLKLKLG